MKQITILLMILLVVGLGTICARATPKYGKEYNEQRKQVGLPLIPDNWKLDSVLQGSSTWGNPERVEKMNNHIPVHWSKGLDYRTGTLISETDTYYGNDDYTHVDGTFRESLGITYYYQIDDYSSEKRVGWSATIVNEASEGVKKISLEEAEKILKDWKIERLDYDF